MHVKHLSELTAFAPDKLAKHNLFQTERFFLDVYCLLPGQAQKAHAHAGSDKVYVVLDGTCRFTVDGESGELGPGAAVFCPSGSEHGVDNPGPTQARLLVMMAPAPQASKK
jgi:quercetin dioxygenase-like cupin family protein